MTTTTSYSKKNRWLGLYKTTLRRNAGYFGLISALFAIFYPFQYAMEAFKTQDLSEYTQETIALFSSDPFWRYDFYGLGMNFTAVSTFIFAAIMLLAPLVLALVLNSYMHSKKAADVYHALPISRECLISVNAAVTMTIIAVPLLVSNLLIAVMQIAKFGFHAELIGYMALDTVGWLAAAFAIYAITTFVSVCVGTVFDTFVFSGVLLVTAPVLTGLFLALASSFLYGFRVDDIVMRNIFLLSPLFAMPARFAFSNSFAGTMDYLVQEEQRLLLYSNLSIVFYLVLAAVLLALTMRLYRKRGSELAETTTSRGVLQIIIKMIGTLVCGICTGFVFYSIGYPQSKPTFVVWMLIGGILSYAIIEVILNRGFKTLVKSLPLGVAMVAVSAGLSAILLTGGLGYENRMPNPAKITSVDISYTGRQASGPNWVFLPWDDNWASGNSQILEQITVSEPGNIDAVLAFHQSAAEKKLTDARAATAEVKTVWVDMKINYTLAGGGKMTRYYNRVDTDTIMKLLPLETSSEAMQQSNPMFVVDPANITGWTLTDIYGSKEVRQLYSPEESGKLLEAIRADLTAQTPEELLHPTKSPLGYISFTAGLPREGNTPAASSGHFILTDPSQQTYQFLQSKGLLEQIVPDLSNCVAVTVQTDGYSNRGEKTAIFENNPNGMIFMHGELDDLRRSIEDRARRLEQAIAEGNADEVAWEKRYEKEAGKLIENPEDIRALADAVVGTYTVGERVLLANFYFEGTSGGISVYIPVSRLPANIQEQVNALF